MISTAEEIQALSERIRRSPWVAIDTEADSLHAYPEKLCLLQIAIEGEAVLVDPLADVHLEPLWEAFDGREMILHAADYDLRLLFQGHHFKPTVLFDTMWAARLLGEERFGLNDVLTKFLGITLEKGAQKANWGRRPLTDRMVSYALNDVRHLRELEQILRDRLAGLGRLEWHRQTCDQLIEDCARPARVDPDQVWRIKGHDKLDSLGLAVLRELWHWREREALRTGRPPFFILSHERLSDLAGQAAEKGRATVRFPAHLTPRRRREIIETIDRALDLSPSQRPHPVRRSGRRMTRRELDDSEELRVRRDDAAGRLGLDPSLIAPKATLFALARNDPGEWERVLPWQRAFLEVPPGRVER